MKNLKNLGKILNKNDQKLINGGNPGGCIGFSGACTPSSNNSGCCTGLVCVSQCPGFIPFTCQFEGIPLEH
ncbi:hypothetical protein D7030_08240 [Flavobacteriaceae bacterium AU392]|nr:hypothetical protein D1817_00175 [Flavobacteriaceae bacterium]RKM85111.1 hypothetical protein D7030_08240 [Flavobacteriaceae bacterium AU392]